MPYSMAVASFFILYSKTKNQVLWFYFFFVSYSRIYLGLSIRHTHGYFFGFVFLDINAPFIQKKAQKYFPQVFLTLLFRELFPLYPLYSRSKNYGKEPCFKIGMLYQG
jgi:hypothetical protein